LKRKTEYLNPSCPGIIIYNDDASSSLSSEDNLSDEAPQGPLPLTEPIVPEEVNTDAEPDILRCLNHAPMPSAAGTVMQGIQIESRTDHAIREVKEASECTHTP